MLVLIHDEWPKARWNLVNLSTQSTHNAIQAWMQATQVQVRAALHRYPSALCSPLCSSADQRLVFCCPTPCRVGTSVIQTVSTQFKLCCPVQILEICCRHICAESRMQALTTGCNTLIACQDLMGSRSPMDEAEDGMPGAAGVSASANAAKRMVQAVQQFVAMLQIHLVRAPPSVSRVQDECPATQCRVLVIPRCALDAAALPGMPLGLCLRQFPGMTFADVPNSCTARSYHCVRTVCKCLSVYVPISAVKHQHHRLRIRHSSNLLPLGLMAVLPPAAHAIAAHFAANPI